MKTSKINIVPLIKILDTKFLLDSKIKQHLPLCGEIMVLFFLPAYVLHFLITQEHPGISFLIIFSFDKKYEEHTLQCKVNLFK